MKTEKEPFVATDFHNDDDKRPWLTEFEMIELTRNWEHPDFQYTKGHCEPATKWAELLHVSVFEFTANLEKLKYMGWFKVSEKASSIQNISEAHKRTDSKQAKYWEKIGKIAEENPNLPYEVLKDILLGLSAIEKEGTKPLSGEGE